MSSRFPGSKKASIVGTFLILIIIALSAALIPSSKTQFQTTPRRAPLNPLFKKYLLKQQSGLSLIPSVEGRHRLGEIPSPNIPSSVRPFPQKVRQAASVLFYDLRNADKLTAIRDQGSCGSCWAFATYGSIESFLMPAEPGDYSENHLIKNHLYSLGPCVGGNIYMSMAYLTRWAGPFAETEDPYPYASANRLVTSSNVEKHVQEIRLIPPRGSPTSNDLLKQAVVDRGAVYVSMNWANNGWNPAQNSYYNNGKIGSGGAHAVCLVGWDDNFDRNKFSILPEGDGAFIVRNSWGSGWGENGYFYVSYYDVSFGRNEFSASFGAESKDNYAAVYQYDPLGWVTSWGYGNDEAWGANIFKAGAQETIAAVGFYTVSSNGSFEIRVYAGSRPGSPTSGILKGSAAGMMAYPGYHTIAFPGPIPISKGQNFSIVFRGVTPGYNFPIASEQAIPGYSDAATCSAGQSYLSPDGSHWKDVSADPATKSNVCLKAFTARVPDLTVTSPSAGVSWLTGTQQTIAWTRSGGQHDNVKIQLWRSRGMIKNIISRTFNDERYVWAVPKIIGPASDYFIRIKTLDGKIKSDSERFSISKPILAVITPGSGASWTRRTVQTITWTTNAFMDSKVNIALFRAGFKILDISRSAPNNGSFNWTIPARIVPGSGYSIRIRIPNGKLTCDGGQFSIK